MVHLRSLGALVALPCLLGALLSCQSATSPDPVTPDPPRYTLDFDARILEPMPDSLAWRSSGNGSGEASVEIASGRASVVLPLKNAPKDTVFLDFWSAGVRYKAAYFSKDLAYLGTWSDPLAVQILRQISPSVAPDSFVAAFAAAVLRRDTLLTSRTFSSALPQGLDSLVVVREIARQAASKGTSFTVAAQGALAIGIDSTRLKALIRDLARTGSIADTSKLFGSATNPPGHDSTSVDTTRHDTTGVDTTGHDTTGVDTTGHDTTGVDTTGHDTTGVDTTGHDTTGVDTTGHDTTNHDTTGVDTTGHDTTGVRDTSAPRLRLLSPSGSAGSDSASLVFSWIVTDDLQLREVRIGDSLVSSSDSVFRLRVQLRVGTNVVRIAARDSSGNQSRDSVVVVRTDARPPVVVRLAGTADRRVSYDTGNVEIGWIVRDESPLGAVTIAGLKVSGVSDSVFKTAVFLAVGRNVLHLVATDAAGNRAEDSVVIERADHDSIAPVIVRADAQTASRTVLFNVKTATVSWKVTDASPLSVLVNDSAVSAVAGVYTSTVSLVVGSNKIRIRATDTARNVAWDSIVISRTPADSFAATWRIDSTMQSTLVDQSGHGLDLKLAETGKWTRAFDSTLTSPSSSSRILYSAKVYMTAYPESTIYNKAAVVMGFYEGMKMGVSTTGQLMVAGQKGDAGAFAWYGPRTLNGAVPLNRWTTLAVGTDQATGEFYAWIDGVPVQLYSSKAVAGARIRVAASSFALGADAVDGQKFTGKIAEAKVINRFIYGAGLAVKLESCIENNCAATLVPNAYWKPDSVNQPTLSDKSGHGLALTRVATGIWSRAFDTSLVAGLPSGRILYTTQVKLSAYPASTTYNKAAVVVGFYEGMKMGISTSGQLMVAGQRGTPGANTWYGPRSVAGAVPLNRWVTLAVGTDQATGEFYAWIDGIPQRLYSATTVAGTKIRVATTSFGLGADLTDGQKFEGQIGDVKVWKDFIYGPGLTVGLDPTIAN